MRRGPWKEAKGHHILASVLSAQDHILLFLPPPSLSFPICPLVFAEEMCACPGTVVLSLASIQSLELSLNLSSCNLLFILQSLLPLGPGELPCPVSMATAPAGMT